MLRALNNPEYRMHVGKTLFAQVMEFVPWKTFGRIIGRHEGDAGVRTPASPLCRSTIRPKAFHGTNSITCANSVLPTFMRHPGLFKPASIANKQPEIQIVDTHESLETRVSIGFAGF